MDLKFKEAHVTGGEGIITITEENAIKFTKECNPHHPDMSDDEALKHFILVNRAYYEEGDCLHRVHGH